MRLESMVERRDGSWGNTSCPVGRTTILPSLVGFLGPDHRYTPCPLEARYRQGRGDRPRRKYLRHAQSGDQPRDVLPEDHSAWILEFEE
jgi:hypothetical protein